MWELDHEEGWALKKWRFWTVVLEKTLESPLDCKEIQPVHPKGNQSWMFIGRTDVEAETPILWPSDEKNWLIGKDPDAGKDWGQEEKGTTEDEMAGWHHRFNGHGFESVLGVVDGHASLVCCSLWGRKSQTQLSNWTELKVWRVVYSWEWMCTSLEAWEQRTAGIIFCVLRVEWERALVRFKAEKISSEWIIKSLIP